MSLQVRPLDPRRDDTIARVFDSAFAREKRESELALSLARHPDFDPELCLVAERDGQVLGAALFMPQTIRMYGSELASASCAPIGVVPDARGKGAGTALVTEGLRLAKARGIRCVTAIGAPEFFTPLGFGSAFELFSQRVPVSVADEFGMHTAEWRGLQGSDLAQLPELDRACWNSLDGSLVRGSTERDWEASAERSHAMCFEHGGQLEAYVRFRVRGVVEITDCCVRSTTGIGAIFALASKLGREHACEVVEFRMPPEHPVARAAFRNGCPIESSDFGGASLLAVLDWENTFRDLGSILAPRLLRAARPSLSLQIDGKDYRLSFERGAFECQRGRDAEQHFEVPNGWAPGLLTGKLSGSELAFETRTPDPQSIALLDALFPKRPATWAYGPSFEIADD